MVQVTNAGTVRLIWVDGSGPYAINVLGIMGTAVSAPTPTNVAAFSSAVKAAYTSTALATFHNNGTALAQVNVRNLNLPDQPEIPGGGTQINGGSTEDRLPPQTSLVVTLRTALAGPAFRGRVYLPSWAENANDIDGTCSTAASAAAVAFVTAIDNAAQAQGWSLAVVGRPFAGTPEITIAARPARTGQVNDVTVIEARDNVWDTQRRRAQPGV